MATKTKFNKKDTIVSMYNLNSSLRAIATACNTTVDFVKQVLSENSKEVKKENSNEIK